MLKSSSLCLYSSNLGTFWLKIEQFWPFEEISIFSNSGHLEWRAGLSVTILKGTHPGTILARFGLIWIRCTFEFNIFCTLVTTVAILIFFQPPKSCHTLRWIFLQSFMKFDERNQKKILIPLFCFYGNCGKVCLTNYDFFFWLISFH